jgi:hypothetical protein
MMSVGGRLRRNSRTAMKDRFINNVTIMAMTSCGLNELFILPGL